MATIHNMPVSKVRQGDRITECRHPNVRRGHRVTAASNDGNDVVLTLEGGSQLYLDQSERVSIERY